MMTSHDALSKSPLCGSTLHVERKFDAQLISQSACRDFFSPRRSGISPKRFPTCFLHFVRLIRYENGCDRSNALKNFFVGLKLTFFKNLETNEYDIEIPSFFFHFAIVAPWAGQNGQTVTFLTSDETVQWQRSTQIGRFTTLYRSSARH